MDLLCLVDKRSDERQVLGRQLRWKSPAFASYRECFRKRGTTQPQNLEPAEVSHGQNNIGHILLLKAAAFTFEDFEVGPQRIRFLGKTSCWHTNETWKYFSDIVAKTHEACDNQCSSSSLHSSRGTHSE